MTTLNDLELSVISWAQEVGLLSGSNPIKQAHKTIEEAIEMLLENFALEVLVQITQTYPRLVELQQLANIGKHNAIKEYGDVVVTVIIGLALHNSSLSEALELALAKIQKRVGSAKMINGMLVKAEDQNN